MVDRQQERINAVGGRSLPTSRALAAEQFVGVLEGCTRQLLCAEGALQRLSDVANIARQILPQQPQRQIAQYAAQHRRQIAMGSKIARQRTRDVAKAPLRLRTEDEQLVRRQIAVLEQPAVDRVKEAFGDLETRIVRQQVDIDCFDPAGEVGVEVFLPGDAFELLHHRADVMVVQMDALFIACCTAGQSACSKRCCAPAVTSRKRPYCASKPCRIVCAINNSSFAAILTPARKSLRMQAPGGTSSSLPHQNCCSSVEPVSAVTEEAPP